MIHREDINLIGNRLLLLEHKIAFLCSRRYPESISTLAHRWAKQQRENGRCIISGFHSPLEKDVFRLLLKGNQPLMLVMARGLKKRFEPEINRALAKNRLLILTPFPESVTRITAETAARRNELMAELADETIIAYAAKGGNLERLVESLLGAGKRLLTFDLPENRELIKEGAKIYPVV